MAQIQNIPYLSGKELDQQTLQELDNWFSEMTSLVNSGILQDSTEAVILTSPNGTRYRLTVANDGTLSTTAV